MNRNEYLGNEHVNGFIDWLVSAVNGDIPVIHSFYIRDPRLPRDYIHGREFRVGSLEDAFLSYFWYKEDYNGNALKLADVQIAVRNSVTNQTLVSALNAIHEVLKWGAGGVGTRLYKDNMEWARQQGDGVVECLSRGRLTMDSDELSDLLIFSRANGPRMNAGYTKYYALACQNSIIYDGRVGAALGLLVRNYCIHHGLDRVPEELAFRWGAQSGKNPLNRNPSVGTLVFKKLYTDGRIWAEWNKKANWILQSAIGAAHAEWINVPDGLRRLEASLFMLGYSMDII